MPRCNPLQQRVADVTLKKMYENGHRMSDFVHKKFEYFYSDFKLLAGLAMAAFTD